MIDTAKILELMFADPRSYALGVALWGWWQERQRTKQLHAQMAATMDKITDALLAFRAGG